MYGFVSRFAGHFTVTGLRLSPVRDEDRVEAEGFELSTSRM